MMMMHLVQFSMAMHWQNRITFLSNDSFSQHGSLWTESVFQSVVEVGDWDCILWVQCCHDRQVRVMCVCVCKGKHSKYMMMIHLYFTTTRWNIYTLNTKEENRDFPHLITHVCPSSPIFNKNFPSNFFLALTKWRHLPDKRHILCIIPFSPHSGIHFAIFILTFLIQPIYIMFNKLISM